MLHVKKNKKPKKKFCMYISDMPLFKYSYVFKCLVFKHSVAYLLKYDTLKVKRIVNYFHHLTLIKYILHTE
jgi:hypothetical protein